MTAYYNEFDPSAAAWLRELIAGGQIAPGDVDERDIRDIRPDDLRDYNQCHFFAGIGGWSLALRMAGWPDDRPVWTGSCPCQPFSAAGKRAGVDDERHLWPAFFHLIAECAPPVVLGEQVASKDGLGWLDLVCADMEGAGYAIGSADMCVAGIGGPHIRQRLWFGAERLADAASSRHQPREGVAGIRGQDAGETATAVERGALRATGGLADAERDGQHRGGDAGARRRDEPANGGTTGRVADADDAGSQGRGQPKRGRAAERASGPSGVVGRVGDAGSFGRIGWQGFQAGGFNGWADAGRQQGHNGPVSVNQAGDASSCSGPLHGFWRDADWLLCRDGKWRPVEPGTFPLAHGVSGRVGLLRGYGNAISPPVAAEFIQAWEEARVAAPQPARDLFMWAAQ